MSDGQVLVVGGGTMGRGIASLCASNGYRTLLFESDPAARAGVRPAIESSWNKAVEKGKLAAEAAAMAQRRLEIPVRLEIPPGCEFVVEAVPEDLDLKKRIFAQLDRMASQDTILASNTSSLSITSIAGATTRPDRVLGIHFFNPVAVMPLVEIVSGRDTSRRTAERAGAFVTALGKQAVHVKDSPGFATSRLGVALGLEAMRMVEEGVASPADIDRAMELGYGHRMGPLKTSDLVGLDVRLSIAETLASSLDGRRFAPPQILRRMVARGQTGKKSGRGFYRWEGDEAVAVAMEEVTAHE